MNDESLPADPESVADDPVARVDLRRQVQSIMGEGGNCLATAVGCCLRIPAEEIPHFVGLFGRQWLTALNAWLDHKELGLEAILLPYRSGVVFPYAFVIAIGFDRDSPHAVVYHRGRLFWDPSGHHCQGIDRIESVLAFVALAEDE